MEEIDIWRSAALLIREHGEDADLRALRYVYDMIARDNPQGEVVWKRVMQAIHELQSLSAGQRVH